MNTCLLNHSTVLMRSSLGQQNLEENLPRDKDMKTYSTHRFLVGCEMTKAAKGTTLKVGVGIFEKDGLLYMRWLPSNRSEEHEIEQLCYLLNAE